jgi:tRNA(fMet)-specific endonuclease VapC
MKYLLDTNICIGIINGKPEKVRLNAAEALDRNGQFTTSSIVVHELWYGVAKSHQVDRNARALLGFLSRDIEVLEFTERDAQAAGEIRAELERSGVRIGEYDTLIAGQAFCRNLVLVTANTREFARVRGLVVEDWTS